MGPWSPMLLSWVRGRRTSWVPSCPATSRMALQWVRQARVGAVDACNMWGSE
jgi:hypothetical protein